MKKTAIILKLISIGLIFTIGFIIFLKGCIGVTVIVEDYDGNFTSYETYGGDAYTGIQNAAADAANNVDDLGDFLNEAIEDALEYTLENAYFWIGLLLMVVSTYLLACTLTTIECKKKNPSEDTATLNLTKSNSLLDSGAITQEEFDEKKKEIFNM